MSELNLPRSNKQSASNKQGPLRGTWDSRVLFICIQNPESAVTSKDIKPSGCRMNSLRTELEPVVEHLLRKYLSLWCFKDTSSHPVSFLTPKHRSSLSLIISPKNYKEPGTQNC